MKKINFLVSEYRDQIQKIHKKTRPFVIFFSVSFAAILGYVLFSLIFHTKTEKYISDQDNLQILFLTPITLFLWYVSSIFFKAEFYFWKGFAEKNEGVYRLVSRVDKENAVMFQQGTDQSIFHYVTFQEGNEETRIFSYSFNTGSGKQKVPHRYTVIAFSLLQTVPHIYLNYKSDRFGVSIGEKIPIPTEFEKSFTISTPKGYHLEALEIFTPDILAAILDLNITLDIEIIDNQIYFFVEKYNSFGVGFTKYLAALEEKYTAVMSLMELLKPKLDQFRFTPIGDLPHRL